MTGNGAERLEPEVPPRRFLFLLSAVPRYRFGAIFRSSPFSASVTT
jgi:hypothetical protein